MKKKKIENPTAENDHLADDVDPLIEAREMVDAALDLMSNKILEALREFDWAKWQRRNCIPRTANIHRLAQMLCRLNRALLLNEKDSARRAANRQKTESELAHILPFLDCPELNPPNDKSGNDEPNNGDKHRHF